MTQSHILDLPAWSALTGRQADLGIRRGSAARFQEDISIWAAVPDQSDEAIADLAQLVPEEGQLHLGQIWEVRCPPGARIVASKLAFEMISEGQTDPVRHDHQIEALHEADWPEMLALAQATQPGPFARRTPVMGEYWGVRRDGNLVAMGGERLKQDKYVEISGICTASAYRGQGLGKALCAHVRDRIKARGEVPYLHVYASNEGAQKLYHTLGFRKRCEKISTLLEKA
jgi:predicted GNAT family acetyltransferase